jgi:hypothetical protein
MTAPTISADAAVASVLELAGVRSFGLDALLRVSSIEWSTDVATACVECSAQPRLLFNPDFVAKHCTTPQKLAFLLLHEMSHISLGHTGLYTRITPAQNIAYDAVINATILHGLRQRGITLAGWDAMPLSTYSATKEPEFILRPPPGWPDAPSWKASAGLDPTLREIHERLYNARQIEDLTYGEIVRALAPHVVDPTSAGELVARLLGAHGTTEGEQRAMSGGRDANAHKMLGAVIAALPINEGVTYGKGFTLESVLLRAKKEERMVVALRSLMRKALINDCSVRRVERVPVGIMTADSSRDRRAAVRRYAARTLGAPAPLLFRGESTRVLTTPDGACSIYLDVSGSMGQWPARLHAALQPLRRLIAPELHAFSTEVVSMSRAEFLRGRVRTTGGTDVGVVLEHVTARARHRRPYSALLLTDGYFAPPPAPVLQAFRASGARLHVGVVARAAQLPAWDWAASVTRLSET